MTYDQRIEICKACEHYSSVGTCGTPIVGHTVIHNGEEMKLCGCFMRIKAAIPALSCPLDKWIGYITERERLELKEMLENSIRSGVMDAQVITDYWNKLNPGNRKGMTTCVPCIATMRNELLRLIKDRRPKQ